MQINGSPCSLCRIVWGVGLGRASDHCAGAGRDAAWRPTTACAHTVQLQSADLIPSLTSTRGYCNAADATLIIVTTPSWWICVWQTVANDSIPVRQGRTAGGGRRAPGTCRRRHRCRRPRRARARRRQRQLPHLCSSARSARSVLKTRTSCSAPVSLTTSSASPAPETPSSDSKDQRLVLTYVLFQDFQIVCQSP